MTDQPRPSKTGCVTLERVQELTWALLDEQITSDEKSLLETALVSDVQSRETYVECVRLHTDLVAHYAGNAAPPAPASTKSPVLGFLNAGMPPLGLQSNPVEGTSP
jgi:hypothetical protein